MANVSFHRTCVKIRAGPVNLHVRPYRKPHYRYEPGIMENLSTYVAAIHRRASPLAISDMTTETSSWHDQGFEVSKEVTDYRFDNGVVIRRTVEQDNFPSEAVCAEIWITYEVIAKGNVAADISPPRQVFENACRESFWLSYHTT